jgi:hypothetical protein
MKISFLGRFLGLPRDNRFDPGPPEALRDARRTYGRNSTVLHALEFGVVFELRLLYQYVLDYYLDMTFGRSSSRNVEFNAR